MISPNKELKEIKSNYVKIENTISDLIINIEQKIKWNYNIIIFIYFSKSESELGLRFNEAQINQKKNPVVIKQINEVSAIKSKTQDQIIDKIKKMKEIGLE